MKAYELAFIGLRLLAIYILFRTLTLLTSTLPFVIGIFLQENVSNEQVMLSATVSSVTLVIALLCPILLWSFARKIAAWVSGDLLASSINYELNATLDLLISAMGLFIIVITLPDLLAWIFSMITLAPRYAGQVSQMLLSGLDRPIGMLLKLLFGVILLVKTKGIARWIHKLKYT